MDFLGWWCYTDELCWKQRIPEVLIKVTPSQNFSGEIWGWFVQKPLPEPSSRRRNIWDTPALRGSPRNNNPLTVLFLKSCLAENRASHLKRQKVSEKQLWWAKKWTRSGSFWELRKNSKICLHLFQPWRFSGRSPQVIHPMAEIWAWQELSAGGNFWAALCGVLGQVCSAGAPRQPKWRCSAKIWVQSRVCELGCALQGFGAGLAAIPWAHLPWLCLQQFPCSHTSLFRSCGIWELEAKGRSGVGREVCVWPEKSTCKQQKWMFP